MQSQAMLDGDSSDNADLKPTTRLSSSSSLTSGEAKQQQQLDTSSIKALVSSSIESITEPVKHTLASPALRKAAVSSLVLAAITAVSLGSAVFAYIVFYYIYVPRVGFSKEMWLQYGQGKTPFAHVDLKTAALARDMAYDVILDLVVPASPRNIELGNFMVDLALQAPDGTAILRSSRSASLTWVPAVARFFKTLLRLPVSLFFDSYSHNQHILVPLITKRSLRTFSTPTIASAFVQIGRPGNEKHLPGELQIHSATLRFIAHLSGLRWLMYHHRIISFFLFCGVFFSIALLTALALWVSAGFFFQKEDPVVPKLSIEGNEPTSVKTEEGEDSDTSFKDDTEPTKPIVGGRTSLSRKSSRDDPARTELQDQAARLEHARSRGDRFLHNATDTDNEEESVLKDISFTSVASASDDDDAAAKMVKQGSASSSDRSGSQWQEIDRDGNVTMKVKKELKEEETFIAPNESSSLKGKESTTTARVANEETLRRRASNRSLRAKDEN